MEQIDALDIIEPINPRDLTSEERNRVLEYLTSKYVSKGKAQWEN
jgi:hypothetical protein